MRNDKTDSDSYAFDNDCNVVESTKFFSQSAERNRKCCSFCSSVRISRRTRIGGYTCSDCKKSFNIPNYKFTGVNGRLPASLLPREVQA